MITRKAPAHLTNTQRYVVEKMTELKGSFIYYNCSKRSLEWKYYLGQKGQSKSAFFGVRHPQTIDALIRRGVLIPEMSDEEFEIQFALGSIDHRIYNLPKK